MHIADQPRLFQSQAHLLDDAPGNALQCAAEALRLFQQEGLCEGVGAAWLACADARLAAGASSPVEGGARRTATSALALFRELRHRRGEALALHSLARVARAEGDLEGSQRAAHAALALFRALGDRRGEAFCFYELSAYANTTC